MSEFTLCQLAYNSPEYHETVALRHEILRAPIGLEFPTSELEIEHLHLHLACYRNEQLAGCLVLVPINAREIKMRQVAVAHNAQRSGVGRALVEFAERVARENGFAVMTLHARATAVEFYLRLGYQSLGEAFEEVGLEHREMRKTL